MLHRLVRRLARKRLTPDPPPTPTDTPQMFAEIDQFVCFLGFLHLRGRFRQTTQPIKRVAFRVAQTVVGETTPDGIEFEMRQMIGDANFTMVSPSLLVTQADGSQVVIEHPSGFPYFDGTGMTLYGTFLDRLKAMPPGNFLEIGSRARSGNLHRNDVPPTWNVTGTDILPGEGVDVVCDAHALSAHLARNQFDAVLSMCVFEHLAMPWKIVLEMNHVMTPGALGFVYTNQTFPLHDEPWDYYRFSTWAWPTLFNERTGFRIIEVGSALPVYVVAQHWNPSIDHRTIPGVTVSSVLFEKITDTDLAWPVDSNIITESQYPG